MGINAYDKFESHMDVLSPETTSDTEKVLDFDEEEDLYDDLFDEKLKTANVAMAFKGIADSNPQYGEGGGKQLFISDFSALIRNGKMIQIGEEILKLDIGINANHPVFRDSLDGKYKILQDERSIQSEEEQQLDENTDIRDNTNFNGQIEMESDNNENKSSMIVYSKDIDNSYERTIRINNVPLSDDEAVEWLQLDENTPDEQSLAKAMNSLEKQQQEDWRHPLSDQEDSGGKWMPDGWSNPLKLKNGDIYYQIRPINNAERESPYVTDQKTIEECRNQNGEIDIANLLQKLQINPGNNTKYILKSYVYSQNGK